MIDSVWVAVNSMQIVNAGDYSGASMIHALSGFQQREKIPITELEPIFQLYQLNQRMRCEKWARRVRFLEGLTKYVTRPNQTQQ